jgi:NADP-dependent 3-hydroxy acid dehydrogenase YdfG
VTETDAVAPPAGDDVIAIVGAGPGIGASVARRFAEAGYAVGLVARDGQRLARMAAELTDETDQAAAFATADAADPDQLARAIGSVTDELGRPGVLCFSPIPDIGLIGPVLETSPEDFMSSLRLNIAGAAAAVRAVLPSMLDRGQGSLLFTTGSAALNPSADRAASAVTTTAATAYIALLRDALAGTGVRVGHTVIAGPIDRDRDDAHDPDDVAADLWRHHEGSVPDFPTVLRLP